MVRHQVVVDAPRARVFEYVDGYQNVPEYLMGVTGFEPRTSQTQGLGSIFEVTVDVGPKKLKSVVRCTEYIENELIELKAIEASRPTPPGVSPRPGAVPICRWSSTTPCPAGSRAACWAASSGRSRLRPSGTPRPPSRRRSSRGAEFPQVVASFWSSFSSSPALCATIRFGRCREDSSASTSRTNTMNSACWIAATCESA